jgi:hypothetical protein
MKHYKISFLKSPNIHRHPDNPPVEQVFFFQSQSEPTKEMLITWFYDNVGNATAFRVEIAHITFMSEDEFQQIPKHNRQLL